MSAGDGNGEGHGLCCHLSDPEAAVTCEDSIFNYHSDKVHVTCAIVDCFPLLRMHDTFFAKTLGGLHCNAMTTPEE